MLEPISPPRSHLPGLSPPAIVAAFFWSIIMARESNPTQPLI